MTKTDKVSGGVLRVQCQSLKKYPKNRESTMLNVRKYFF